MDNTNAAMVHDPILDDYPSAPVGHSVVWIGEIPYRLLDSVTETTALRSLHTYKEADDGDNGAPYLAATAPAVDIYGKVYTLCWMLDERYQEGVRICAGGVKRYDFARPYYAIYERDAQWVEI